MEREGGGSGKVPEWAEARGKLERPPLEERLSDDEVFVLEILSRQRKLLDQILSEFNAPRKAVGKEPVQREALASLLEGLREKGFINKIEVWEITRKGERYLREM